MMISNASTPVPMATQGIYYTAPTGAKYYATQCIFHTLGAANEFEQGSGNGLPEPWDYFPFNDRDFTSVAELMLVPGCSPGLFTKQFVEFAPAIGTVANIFNAVIPNYGPPLYVAPPSPVTTPAALQRPAVTTTGAAIVGAYPPPPAPALTINLPPPPQPAPLFRASPPVGTAASAAATRTCLLRFRRARRPFPSPTLPPQALSPTPIPT